MDRISPSISRAFIPTVRSQIISTCVPHWMLNTWKNYAAHTDGCVGPLPPVHLVAIFGCSKHKHTQQHRARREAKEISPTLSLQNPSTQNTTHTQFSPASLFLSRPPGDTPPQFCLSPCFLSSSLERSSLHIWGANHFLGNWAFDFIHWNLSPADLICGEWTFSPLDRPLLPRNMLIWDGEEIVLLLFILCSQICFVSYVSLCTEWGRDLLESKH